MGSRMLLGMVVVIEVFLLGCLGYSSFWADGSTMPVVRWAGINLFFVPVIAAVVAFVGMGAWVMKARGRGDEAGEIIEGAATRLGMAILVVGAVTMMTLFPASRADLHDKSIADRQIQAAADQYILENGNVIFLQYDDLVGFDKYVKAINPAGGEDYHEYFPRRIDDMTWVLTMADGHRIIGFYAEEEQKWYGLKQRTDGALRAGFPEAVPKYEAWLKAQKRPDGARVKVVKGGRFEITYRGGVPDGPFKAYYANGKLWGEATYRNGRPVGAHKLYDEQGKVVLEVKFPEVTEARWAQNSF